MFYALLKDKNIGGEKMSEQNERAASLLQSRHFSKGTIVVIDDHDPTLDFLKEALTRLGYKPLLAEGGAEGLELCRSNDVHLVLTDYLMPEMSGLEVAEKIKALPHPLPVILTSASHQSANSDLYRKGVDYFLNKPFRLEDLESTIEEALQQKN
jgi:CheY-like chemotaxis protein